MTTDELTMINAFARACRYMSYLLDELFTKFESKITGLYVIDSCFVSNNSIVGISPKSLVNMSITMNGNNELIEVIISVDDFNWNVKVFNATKQICDDVAYSSLGVIDIIEKYVNGDYDAETK